MFSTAKTSEHLLSRFWHEFIMKKIGCDCISLLSWCISCVDQGMYIEDVEYNLEIVSCRL